MAPSERLNATLQENVITTLAYDDVHGKIVANLISPDLFEGEYRIIAERCIDYWRQHQKAPKAHIGDLVSDVIEDPQNKKGQTYRRILISMLQLSESINSIYVVNTLSNFVQQQKLKSTIIRAYEVLEAKQDFGLQEARDLLDDVLRAREINFDPGLSLLDYERVLQFLQNRHSEFITGIKQLDERSFVPARQAVLLFLAPTGRGKTWFLVHIGRHAIMQRKKVVHITLELTAEETLQRYYQNFFSIPKRHLKDLETTSFRFDEYGKLEGFDFNEATPEFTFSSQFISDELSTRIVHFGQKMANIRVIKFPMRSLTVNGIRAYLDTLEIIDKFIPDMLILDYIGVMKTDDRNHRISLGRVFEDFKGLCDERNVAGVVVQQVSKIGATAENVSHIHVAEDWSLTNTADQILTYTCTNAEFKYGLARLFAAKARSEEDKFGVLLTQNYKIGQFCLDSHLLDPKYYELLEELKKDDDEEDDAVEEEDC